MKYSFESVLSECSHSIFLSSLSGSGCPENIPKNSVKLSEITDFSESLLRRSRTSESES